MDESSQLCRIEARTVANGFQWSVFGLNTLRANKVGDTDRYAPHKVWLSAMLQGGEPAVLQGGQAIVDEGEWPDTPGCYWFAVQTTVYGGTLFSSSADYVHFPGVFYPSMPETILFGLLDLPGIRQPSHYGRVTRNG